MRALIVGALLAVGMSSAGAETEAGYREDFEQAAPGSQPNGILVLGGDFRVEALPDVREGNQQAFAVPGQPVGDFGFVFGPRQEPPVEIKARVWAERQGRRLPRFGIGWGGENGLKFIVAPAARKLELYDNLTKLTEAPFVWHSGGWAALVLKIEKQKDQWMISGTVNHKRNNLSTVSISAPLKEAPRAARASAWAQPFAGKPIYFDDLEVNTPGQP
ncbi:MAG: hypothetical protein AAGK14_12315 [Verrucomicrobiota bacterium]